MTRLKRIKRFVAGLLLLAVCSLVVEQLVCLAWVPGYYWKLLASPVFWSLFSAVCFYLLWRFNRKYPDVKNSVTKESLKMNGRLTGVATGNLNGGQIGNDTPLDNVNCCLILER